MPETPETPDPTADPRPDARADVRDRIVDVAADLLRHDGRAAVTTRAVAERAGVQPPTIYRLFGDKEGLLDAVAESEMSRFAGEKAAAMASAQAGDPVDVVEDLRTGWDTTVSFGLANPDLYVLMSDPGRGAGSPAVRRGVALLAERIHRVARAGRLRVPEEHAVELMHAAGTGAVLATLAQPADRRDRALADGMLAAVLDRILVPAAPTGGPRTTRARDAEPGLVERAIALRAHVPEADRLSAGERALLAEWLDRIAAGG